jgi:hypothetical protein
VIYFRYLGVSVLMQLVQEIEERAPGQIQGNKRFFPNENL